MQIDVHTVTNHKWHVSRKTSHHYVVHDCVTFQTVDICKRKVDWNYKNVTELHWKTK